MQDECKDIDFFCLSVHFVLLVGLLFWRISPPCCLLASRLGSENEVLFLLFEECNMFTLEGEYFAGPNLVGLMYRESRSRIHNTTTVDHCNWKIITLTKTKEFV